jgi:SAM-dependent methyltransferase
VTSADELTRLRSFWETRYQRFSLSESGWLGAGEEHNELIYRCKAAVVRRALDEASFDRSRAFSVLDAGCGQGFFASFYAREFPASRYVGVDLCTPAVDHLRAVAAGAQEFATGDLCSWRDPAGRQFDIVQCVEVLHLIVDDRMIEEALTNFARHVERRGRVLVTAALPDADRSIHDYLKFRSRQTFLGLAERAGLVLEAERAMYYWLPDGGPANRYLRWVFAQLGPRSLYATDRLGLALGAPRWLQRGMDSRMKLLTFRLKAS